MSNGKYVLDEHGEPVAEPDLMKWAQAFEQQDRKVAADRIGDVTVSTIFLGIDHNFSKDGPPVLWETMIFGGEHDQFQDRYSSRAEALEGHRKAVEMARASTAVPRG